MSWPNAEVKFLLADRFTVKVTVQLLLGLDRELGAL
jgi:hypothetical protein